MSPFYRGTILTQHVYSGVWCQYEPFFIYVLSPNLFEPLFCLSMFAVLFFAYFSCSVTFLVSTLNGLVSLTALSN